jgi:hypothetical protein
MNRIKIHLMLILNKGILNFKVLLILSVVCILVNISGVMADNPIGSNVITFRLNDIGDYDIQHVSLFKNGESYKDGFLRQAQNIEYNRDAKELIWTPCNDNFCTVPSNPTAGGTTGRDELILTVTLDDPLVNVDSCWGDTTCEKLKGKTITTSGMINGYFKTGKIYDLSIGSLEPGFRQVFQVREIPN